MQIGAVFFLENSLSLRIPLLCNQRPVSHFNCCKDMKQILIGFKRNFVFTCENIFCQQTLETIESFNSPSAEQQQISKCRLVQCSFSKTLSLRIALLCNQRPVSDFNFYANIRQILIAFKRNFVFTWEFNSIFSWTSHCKCFYLFSTGNILYGNWELHGTFHESTVLATVHIRLYGLN